MKGGIAVYRVKPEKKEAFERFEDEVLWPAAQKRQPEVTKQVRFLTPASPEQAEDGIYRYAFVIDPYTEGVDYAIENTLSKALGAGKARQHMKDFDTYTDGYDY